MTMLTLFIASAVAWAHQGNSRINENWTVGRSSLNTATMVKEVFNGVCIGILGLTGFECTAGFHLLDLLKLLIHLAQVHHPTCLVSSLGGSRSSYATYTTPRYVLTS